jgi:hypothetical protein
MEVLEAKLVCTETSLSGCLLLVKQLTLFNFNFRSLGFVFTMNKLSSPPKLNALFKYKFSFLSSRVRCLTRFASVCWKCRRLVNNVHL